MHFDIHKKENNKFPELRHVNVWCLWRLSLVTPVPSPLTRKISRWVIVAKWNVLTDYTDEIMGTVMRQSHTCIQN